jgi:xanthine dehydrogenase accessory factor
LEVNKLDSVNLSVLKTLKDWQSIDVPVWLFTVVETFGSSPRPLGAMLALRLDGLAVGSISGGCIEDDLIKRAQRFELPTDHSEVLTYGLTHEEAMRLKLPCGGVVRLVVEPVRLADWVGDVLERISRHQMVRRTLNLKTLNVTLSEGVPEDSTTYDNEILVTVFGPRWQMLIIGAGQVSSYLARMAQALDYNVFVCDPREEMRETWDVPDTTLSKEMPDDAVLALPVNSNTAVIALTHDPKLDDMALLEALKSPAFYIGAIGSKSNNDKRRQRLALFDLTEEEIARLHGPVGLNISSRTPPEIAIAILAELIQVRSEQKQTANLSANCNSYRDENIPEAASF